jgi:hypothetical protein
LRSSSVCRVTFPEAEQIARRELSPQQADANVAYLRSMLSQQNSWQKLAAKDVGGATTAPTEPFTGPSGLKRRAAGQARHHGAGSRSIHVFAAR